MGGSDCFPGPRTVRTGRTTLPDQSTFVGREGELVQRALVAARRLVTLTGAEGVGKARLAVQAGAELLDGSGDGVWFVDLAPLTDLAVMATTLAEGASTVSAAKTLSGHRDGGLGLALAPTVCSKGPAVDVAGHGRGGIESRAGEREERRMVEPFQAVGLIQSMRGIRRREEIEWNLDHIAHLVKAASWLSSMDLPVRLICIPEGGLQGFTDEVFDLDHEAYARECAIDIPGPETDNLGRLARQWDAYLIAQAKARHPEFPGRFFNVGFVIEPEDGTVVLIHHKLVPLLPVEHSVTPHNVWDRWIELYGRTLDAFYPVADTAIGRIGIMMANEASYPENARGLAMNGCEIAYRGPYPAPGVMNGMFSVQNRARALDNNMYVVGMNLGTYYLDKDSVVPIDTFSGGSQIVDYRGQVVTEVPHGGSSTWIAGTIDIQALRHFRQTAQWDNWMKDLTTEQYQLVYEQPIYPKNLYLDRSPFGHAEYREQVTEKQVKLLQDRGIWTRP
jgi:predicted amidohydrolase